MDTGLNISNPICIKDIIKDLKILDYELDNWDSEFVKTVLTTPCASRRELLGWILKLLGFQYSSHDLKSFNTSVITRIFNDLLSIGLCRSQDINLIDGTASNKNQLKFWRTLIGVALRIRNCNSSALHQSDSLLFKLVTSPQYDASLKDEKLNLLPEDLYPLYKKHSEKLHLKDGIQELKEAYAKEEKGHQLKVKTSNNEDECVENLLQRISGLRTQNETFLDTYESSLKPWCKSPPASQETSSETGELASKCNEELRHFLKFVSLTNDVASTSERITENMDKLNYLRQHDDVSQLLRSTVDS